MGSSMGSNEPINLNEPLPILDSSPLFPIIILSDDEEVNHRNGRRAIFAVPFPNLEEVSSEASQSLKSVFDEVFEFMVLCKDESNDDEWLVNVPPPEMIVISSNDSDEDSREECSN